MHVPVAETIVRGARCEGAIERREEREVDLHLNREAVRVVALHLEGEIVGMTTSAGEPSVVERRVAAEDDASLDPRTDVDDVVARDDPMGSNRRLPLTKSQAEEWAVPVRAEFRM